MLFSRLTGGVPISSHPAIPSALEGKRAEPMQSCLVVTRSQAPAVYVSCSSGDAGYPFAPQQLGLGPEGAKAAKKYGENAGVWCD